jgi:hypothetical protein
MPTLSGLITGTLGYSLKREFLANSVALRDVETYDFDIWSVDMVGQNASTVQSGIKRQFTGVYSGDINVSVFETKHQQSWTSDAFRGAQYHVTVEVRKAPANLSSTQPELGSGYYAGLDASFFTGYGPYLLDFKESFTFSTNQNGNREFNHELGFGLKTGWGSDGATATGRKAYAQKIASGIFSNDKNTTLGFTTMVNSVLTLADSGLTRNYFTESYDLMRNTYSFGRKREILPLDATSGTFNLIHSLSLNSDGTTDVTEKGITQGAINFSQAKSFAETYLSSSYSRCSGIYKDFYNSGVMLQDSQYSSLTWNSLISLINTPTKTIKTYDARSITAGYDVSYTNNPNVTGSGAMISQTVEFDIDTYDKLDASHSFDFSLNKAVLDSGYFLTLMNTVTGASPSYMANHYASYYPSIYSAYPSFSLTKTETSWPNIKSKATTKFTYSNSPSYFVQYDGLTFRVLDYSLDFKKPADIVQEYKIVNRPNKMSVLSYGYQTEKGEFVVNMRISLGKQSDTFFPNGVGQFTIFDGIPLYRWLQAIYKYGGQLMMAELDFPTMGLQWFIDDSKFNVDSDGNLVVQINYVYTYKKRTAIGNP